MHAKHTHTRAAVSMYTYIYMYINEGTLTSAARAFSRLCMPATPVVRQYLYFCTSTHFTTHFAHFKLHACDADVDGLLVRSAAPRFGVLAFGGNALRQHARAEAALHRLERRGRHFRGSFASVFVLLYTSTHFTTHFACARGGSAAPT